jgi:pyruvate formate lyase activating enzyme
LYILERAHDIGREEGAENLALDFVYLGNVLGHPYENTYCPECRELVVRIGSQKKLTTICSADKEAL